jgi:hypothetical protein
MKEIPIQHLMFNSKNILLFLNRCHSHSRLPPIKGENNNSYKINTFNNVHTIIKLHGKEWVIHYIILKLNQLFGINNNNNNNNNSSNNNNNKQQIMQDFIKLQITIDLKLINKINLNKENI